MLSILTQLSSGGSMQPLKALQCYFWMPWLLDTEYSR